MVVMEDLVENKDRVSLEELAEVPRDMLKILDKTIINDGRKGKLPESVFAGYFLPNILGSGSQASMREGREDSVPNPWEVRSLSDDLPKEYWHLYRRHEFRHKDTDYAAYYIPTDELWTSRWFSAMGSFTLEVDVFDDNTRGLLYTVPSLMESFQFGHVEDMPNFRQLTDEAFRRMSVVPVEGKRFMERALMIRGDAIMETVDTSIKSDPRWRDILVRYGYVIEASEKPTDEVEKEEAKKPTKKKLKFNF